MSTDVQTPLETTLLLTTAVQLHSNAVKPDGGRKQFRRVQANYSECGGYSKLSDHAECCSHVNQRHVVPCTQNIITHAVIRLVTGWFM